MSCVGIFISVLSPLFGELYTLRVCYEAVDGEMHRWVFQTAENGQQASGVSDTPPIALETLLILFFFSWMFKSYLALAEQMAQAMTQSVSGNLANTANAVAQSLGVGQTKTGESIQSVAEKNASRAPASAAGKR